MSEAHDELWEYCYALGKDARLLRKRVAELEDRVRKLEEAGWQPDEIEKMLEAKANEL